MWPYLLPAAIGGISSGMAAAGQGKNPLEIGAAALIGGGAGVGLGVGGRMAGQFLAGTPFATSLAPNLYRSASKLPSWLTGMKQVAINPATQTRLGQSAISNLAGTTISNIGALAVPGAATALAGAPGAALKGGFNAARQAAGASQALGLGRNVSGELDNIDAVPDVGKLGEYGGFGTPAEIIDLTGLFAGQRLAGEKEAETQLRNMKLMAPYLNYVTQVGRKAEFERNMAAAGIRQNIATQSTMLQRSQQAAQQMGSQFAGGVVNALTSPVNYS